jgi:hypothetical protein
MQPVSRPSSANTSSRRGRAAWAPSAIVASTAAKAPSTVSIKSRLVGDQLNCTTSNYRPPSRRIALP